MATKKKAAKKTTKKVAKRASATRITAKASAPKKVPVATEKEIAAALASVKKVKPPEIPIDKLLPEARTLVVAATKHAARLAKVGKKPSVIALVAALAALVSDLQLKIAAARSVGRTKAEIATDLAARAYRQRTLEDIEYATDGDEDAAARISNIREGEGVDDLLTDLTLIVAFLLEISEKITAIGQNPNKLATEGKTLESKLASLVDARRTASDDKALTAERDRAATALSAAMSTLRSGGKYAFRDEPENARLYLSTYTRVRKAVQRAQATKAKTAAAKKERTSSVE